MADNYSVKFSGIDIEGIFKDLKGSIQFNEANVEDSKFNFTINVNPINTGNGMKNKHAISDKWFDAESYPTISFESKKVPMSI